MSFHMIADEIEPLVKRYRNEMNIDGIPNQETFTLHRMINPNEPCPLGSLLRINSFGNVFPCQMFTDGRFVIGNIHADKLSEILSGERLDKIKKQNRQRMQKIEECSLCTFKHFCGSGCLAMAFQESGEINQPEPLCTLRYQCLKRQLEQQLTVKS